MTWQDAPALCSWQHYNFANCEAANYYCWFFFFFKGTQEKLLLLYKTSVSLTQRKKVKQPRRADPGGWSEVSMQAAEASVFTLTCWQGRGFINNKHSNSHAIAQCNELLPYLSFDLVFKGVRNVELHSPPLILWKEKRASPLRPSHHILPLIGCSESSTRLTAFFTCGHCLHLISTQNAPFSSNSIPPPPPLPTRAWLILVIKLIDNIDRKSLQHIKILIRLTQRRQGTRAR